ncbi:MAG: hypothetical protein IJQ98_04335 [Oscillospiraceae bacterium]|nr:hypothetical protein [Oscillospiraceae bacterium]
MVIIKYGNRDNPTIVLLTPMMVSGADLYDLMKPYFKGAYHVIAPDQGGHSKAGAYISADVEYRALRSFLFESKCTEIALVYGASLGMAVAWRLFFDSAFHGAHAWFDGVALARNASFAEWLLKAIVEKRTSVNHFSVPFHW